MNYEIVSNNKVELLGEVHSEPVFSHKVYEESFYTFTLKTERLSKISDFIVVTISEHLLKKADFNIGSLLYITGQFRSYNNYSGVGNKLILTVFVKTVKNALQKEDYKNTNYIYLDGFLCKQPVFRITPFGREITDLLVAVNRTYNKSDYIPCIAWGQNARFASSLSIGTNIRLEGRIQSRNYQKQLSEEVVVTKTAYEVSISKISVVEKSNS